MLRFTVNISVISLLLFGFLFAEKEKRDNKLFDRAVVKEETRESARKYIKFGKDDRPSMDEFLLEYRSALSISEDNELKVLRKQEDELGQTHYRMKQYYKGLELFDTRFLVHEENGKVKSANGEIIRELRVSTNPAISEEKALKSALAGIGADRYMWEDASGEELLKKATQNKDATFYPKGTLGIGTESGILSSEKFKLVYRFDIYAAEPMSRHYVDVDARTGKVINKISRIHTGSMAGSGESLYNGEVKMKVAGKNYPEAPRPTYFHVDSWNAYNDDSWHMADTELGENGGYDNAWYQVLDTDPISLSGTGAELTFFHRYSVEPPGNYYSFDAWDGMNLRISTDGGTSWQVLSAASYTHNNLYSFYSTGGEFGMPGWAGLQDSWAPVTVDLTPFDGQTVQIRFAFASDGAFSTFNDPTLFGWQIDEIVVSSTDGTLFSNSGSETGMTPGNMLKEVNFIAGDYRLRQDINGDGIFTYSAQNAWGYDYAVDYVSDSKKNWSDPTGVAVHWATEQTYDYFKTKHNRDSFDDEGGRLISYASYGTGYNNAFWNGQWMTYGDGDGYNFGPLVSVDVVGHELAHGVTERSAGLIYQGESGALNESFSDIFGNLVEFFAEGYSFEAWGMGEDFDLAGNGGFRSGSDPKSKGDPDTYYGQYWRGTTNIDGDNGGVHTNSGVQNYWFYLLAMGGSGTNDNGDEYDVKGIGLDKAAKIAYRNLTIYLTPYSAYYAARNGSIEAAMDLYGKNSKTVKSVKAAWDAVGVYELQPFINLNNLITYVEGLGLSSTNENLLVGLLNDAIGYLGDADFDNTFATLGTFQDEVVAFYPSVIGWGDAWYLLDETDKIYEMYSQNPSPSNNRPKPQVQTAVELPTEFSLEQNYPNPFNPVTTIKFSIAEVSDVQLTVYNSAGQIVKDIAFGNHEPGRYSVQWDGTDVAGSRVASGIYFYRLDAGNFVKTNKMMLIK